MFTNVEKRLKGYAQACVAGATILALLYLVGTAVIVCNTQGGWVEFLLNGVVPALLLVGLSLVGAYFVYGFAEMLESTKRTAYILEKVYAKELAAAEKEARETQATQAEQTQERPQVTEAERAARRARGEAYWVRHPEEREELLKKRAETDKKLRKLSTFASQEQEDQLKERLREIDEELECGRDEQ